MLKLPKVRTKTLKSKRIPQFASGIPALNDLEKSKIKQLKQDMLEKLKKEKKSKKKHQDLVKEDP